MLGFPKVSRVVAMQDNVGWCISHYWPPVSFSMNMELVLGEFQFEMAT